MATATLSVLETFPVGTVVGAYRRELVAEGVPHGVPDDTATVAADGSLVFTALSAGLAYVAYSAAVGRHVSFMPPEAPFGAVPVTTIASPAANQNLAAGAAYDVTLDKNVAFTFLDAIAVQESQIDLELTPDGTGDWNVTWPGSVRWINEIAPVIPQVPGNSLLLSFVSLDGGTTWWGSCLSSAPVGIIASTSYNPADIADGTYAAPANTLADVDAINLIVTFTAPESGQVVVSLCGWAQGDAGGTEYYWGLRSGSTNVANGRVIGGSNGMTITRRFLVTGLTPGTSYSYKWSHCYIGGTAKLYAGGSSSTPATIGPATMTVEAA